MRILAIHKYYWPDTTAYARLLAYPSKTMMYLAAGTPILAIVARASRLATDILEEGLGTCCEQGDSEPMARTILEARPPKRVVRGARGGV